MNTQQIQEFLNAQNLNTKTMVKLINQVYGIKDTPTKIVKVIITKTLLEIIETYYEIEKNELKQLVLEDRFSHKTAILEKVVREADLTRFLQEYEQVSQHSAGAKMFALADCLTYGKSTEEFCRTLNVTLPPALNAKDPELLLDLNRAFFVILTQQFC